MNKDPTSCSYSFHSSALSRITWAESSRQHPDDIASACTLSTMMGIGDRCVSRPASTPHWSVQPSTASLLSNSSSPPLFLLEGSHPPPEFSSSPLPPLRV